MGDIQTKPSFVRRLRTHAFLRPVGHWELNLSNIFINIFLPLYFCRSFLGCFGFFISISIYCMPSSASGQDESNSAL